MSEDLDHNTALANLIETGDSEEVAMILGHKDRLRCGGVIRTGIQFPNSKCTEKERAIYAEMDAQGVGYDTINRAMGGEPKTRTSKLVPKNVDYFVVRSCDFQKPADADFITKNFANADGKVRRFPVWLSVGDIEKVLFHGFRAFSGSQLVATSFYDGKKLKVRYLPKDFKFPVKREDWLIADFNPDTGRKDAKGHPLDPVGRSLVFGGYFRFNVPGLRGFDEIVIPTRSFHGMSYSVALLRRIRSILGRFDGLLNGQPFLEMVKVTEEVKTPDGKKQNQFIPVLELAIDPMELARYAEPRAVVARAQQAMHSLTGRHVAAPPAPVVPVEEDRVEDAVSADPSAPPEDDAPFGTDDPARVTAMEYLHKIAKWSGVTWEQFITWAVLDETGGVSLDDLSIDELRAFAGMVKERCKGGKEKEFGAAVAAGAAAFGVESR